MCARGGYKGGKTPAPKERDKPRCRLAVGAYFFIPDMIILLPSKEATTLLLFRSTPRAAAHGFGIESLKPTEPEPPLLAIKLSSLVSIPSVVFFISYTSFLRRRNEFYIKEASRPPFGIARRVELAQLGFTSPINLSSMRQARTLRRFTSCTVSPDGFKIFTLKISKTC